MLLGNLKASLNKAIESPWLIIECGTELGLGFGGDEADSNIACMINSPSGSVEKKRAFIWVS